MYAMQNSNSTHVTNDEALAMERTNEGTRRDSKDSKTNANKKTYVRSGIFPWGKRGQKGPDGEPVVSARAIDHLRELSAIARGDVVSAFGPTTRAAVVLMAGRHDVYSISRQRRGVSEFREARGFGGGEPAITAILGHKVRWGEGPDLGKAFDAGPVPIEAPLSEGDEVLVPKPAKRKAPAASAGARRRRRRREGVRGAKKTTREAETAPTRDRPSRSSARAARAGVASHQ